MGRIQGSGRTALLVVVLGLVGASSAVAQVSKPWTPAYRIGAGYVVDAPKMMTGGGLFGITPFLGGLGLYVDLKVGGSSPRGKSNFDPTITAQQVDNQRGDLFYTSKSVWQSFNVALVRPVTNELMLYAGGGWATRSDYSEYFDPNKVRGDLGFYWVEKPSTSTGQANVMAGMLVRFGANLNTMFGFETAPKGFTVGVFLTFPGSAG